jgi:hypothetical protein
MTHQRWLWVFLVGVCLAGTPALSPAQLPPDPAIPPEPRYRSHVPIPSRGGPRDFAELLKQLRERRGLMDKEELALAFLRDPEKRKLLQGLIEGLPSDRQVIDTSDPKVKEMAQRLLKRLQNQEGGAGAEERQALEKLKEAFTKGAKQDNKKAEEAPAPRPETKPSQPAIVEPPPRPVPQPPPRLLEMPDLPRPRFGGPGPNLSLNVPEDRELRERVARQLLEWGNRLQNSSAALRESPGLQQALRDIRRYALDKDLQVVGLGRGSRGLKEWLAGVGQHLPRPDLAALPQWSFNPSQWRLPRGRQVNWPRMGSWGGGGPPPFDGGIPGTGLARLGGPASVWQALAWFGALAVIGVAVWKIVQNYRQLTALAKGAGRRLGPWPVHPGRVATRDDIVKAFEYLALLLLGPAARNWNHLQIAVRLAGPQARHQTAADQLAGVYEQARYTPADEPLTDAALASARRDLCQLAGVTSA